MISMHVVNCFVIHMIWGWQASLLFAVHPMSSWGVAWVTGNYYATTAYFTLISYFFLTQVTAWIGVPASMIFYFCALHSTVDAMSFPFMFLFGIHPLGLSLFLPLVIFMRSERWRHGLQKRIDIVKGKQVETTKFEPRRLIFMTKVMANYIRTFFIPMKIYFFGSWAEEIRESKEQWDYYHAINKEFWVSMALCVTTFIAGTLINPIATLWFFVFMGLHSQFNVIGQPFAQRYLYLPQIGLCVLVATVLAPYPLVFIAMVGFLACKTFTSLNHWANQEALLTNEITMNPSRASGFNALGQYYIASKKILEYPHWKINYIACLMRKSVALKPDNWVIQMNFAAFLAMLGRLDEAIEATKRTIELLENFATDRERGNIAATKKQLTYLENLRVEAKRQHEIETRKKKGKK